MAAPSKKPRARANAKAAPLDVALPASYAAAAGTALAAGHVVQFYDTDLFLAEAVAAFFAAGLNAGDACLAVATPAHSEAIERQLRLDGFDLDDAYGQGTFVSLDAETTLQQLLAPSGMPSADRFGVVIEHQIAALARAGRRVRVFGEMVALLWADGNQTGAVQLEELWNALQARLPGLSLCCGYPMRDMTGTENAARFAEVCGQHTHVLPDESYTNALGPAERLRAVALLQQRARSLEAEIAQREHAEARLRASELRYRLLFESALDGILLLDPRSGVVTDANPAALELLGAERAQVVGRELWQTGVLADRESAVTMLLDLEARRTLRYDTLPLCRPDGQARFVELLGTCFEANGEALIQCTLRDVTEHRQMEQRTETALAALLGMAEALVANTPRDLGMGEALLHAPDGASPGVLPPPAVAATARRLAELTQRVLSCGQLSIAAVDPETERMQPLTLVGFPAEKERQWWAGWQPETTLASRLGADVATQLHAGQLVTLDVRAQPHRERLAPFDIQTLLLVPARIGGRLVGGLALLYEDPSLIEAEHERMLAEAVAKLVGLVVQRDRLLREREEARASAIALGEANRRMSDFLSIASHELKTPITVIKANLQLCSRRVRRVLEPPDGEHAALSAVDLPRTLSTAQAMLDRTERGADRLVRLVDDLLDASRIQAGKLELRAEPTELAAIVAEVVEEHREAHPTRMITLRVPPDAVPIEADRDRIRQVVDNYLSNALKYSPARRPVAVCVERDERCGVACVRVRDEGPGLPPEEHSRVWEQFHRAPGLEVLSGSGVGLGLGLHICKTIVERHGGQVGVQSAPGAGSTFWFSLPLPRP